MTQNCPVWPSAVKFLSSLEEIYTQIYIKKDGLEWKSQLAKESCYIELLPEGAPTSLPYVTHIATLPFRHSK